MVAWGSVSRRSVLLALRGTAVAAALLVSAAFVGTLVVDHPRPVAAHDNDDDAQLAAAMPKAGERPVVKLDAEGQEKGGIESAAPAAAAFRTVTRVYGTVQSLDRLTSLYNNALTDAAQLQAAQARAAASLAASVRAKNLLKVFPTAQAQAEAAAATAEVDAAGVEAVKAQAEALRNTAIQDWGTTLGTAIVQHAALATDLVQRRAVLVQITLGAGRAASPPKHITVSVAGGGSAEGRLVSEATQSDPRFPGVGYLYVVPAATGFAAGANVVAELPQGEAQAGLDVPSSAVVWQGGKPWMYVRTAPTIFQRYEIDDTATPTTLGGYVVPAATLPRDKPIVTAGAQILLSQEMHAQIPVDDDN